jgi:hypothetical protein
MNLAYAAFLVFLMATVAGILLFAIWETLK